MNDIWTLIAAERGALADDLSALTPADWQTTSLCPAWTIRDVVAHLTSWSSSTPGRLLASWASHGFNLRTTMATEMRRAAGASTVETLANFRAIQHLQRSIPGQQVTMLGEIVVHAEDVRRPLGLRRDYPAEALRLVADAYVTSDFPVGGKSRVAGLALAASDVDWRHGTGRPVEGPLASLVLAIAGRPAALVDLTGDGVPLLATHETGATR